MRQCDDDVLYRVHCRPAGEDGTHDAAAVADYFNLSVSLGALATGWAKADARFAKLQPHLPGCRMLRQDPAECLFSFICSSNNHISRIHGMVERLCARTGPKLVVDAALSETRKATANPTGTPKKKKRKLANHDEMKAEDDDDDDGADQDLDEGEPLGDFYSFPTVSQLMNATEVDLRAAGFGYRAKFIAGAVAALNAPDGADRVPVAAASRVLVQGGAGGAGGAARGRTQGGGVRVPVLAGQARGDSRGHARVETGDGALLRRPRGQVAHAEGDGRGRGGGG